MFLLKNMSCQVYTKAVFWLAQISLYVLWAQDDSVIITIKFTKWSFHSYIVTMILIYVIIFIIFIILPLFSRFTESFKNEVMSSRVDTTKLLVNAVQKSETKPESFIGISAIGELSCCANENCVQMTYDLFFCQNQQSIILIVSTYYLPTSISKFFWSLVGAWKDVFKEQLTFNHSQYPLCLLFQSLDDSIDTWHTFPSLFWFSK